MKVIALLVPALALTGFTMTNSVPSAEPAARTIYEFKMKDIDGKEVSLDKYKGKVILVVNVASKCGLTPQYEALEKLYEKYKKDGFVILGFPANEFAGQEPGTNEEIKQFCSLNYKVTFPMFAKIVVKGEGICPLYEWLIASSDRPKDEIEWNFSKFIVNREGKVVKRIAPKVKPDDPEVVKALEGQLATK